MSESDLANAQDRRSSYHAADEHMLEASPLPSAFDVGRSGRVQAIAASSRLGGRPNAVARVAAMQQMQRTHGNRAVQRYVRRCVQPPVKSEDYLVQAEEQSAPETPIQRQRVPGPQLPGRDADADEVLRIVGSAQSPGLTAYTAERVQNLLRRSRRQEAIDAIVADMTASGQMDPALLQGGRARLSGAVAGEGDAQPPGYRRDAEGNRVSRPTRLRIGDSAFGRGLPWLYSSIMHEYQHVRQFQTTDEGNRTGSDATSLAHGQANDPGLIHQQEVEAYATEIINSHSTGMFNNKAQMREVWRRLQTEHWQQLSARRRRTLQGLYDQARAIYRESQRQP